MKLKPTAPRVDIDTYKYSSNTYTVDGTVWSVSSLVEYAKENKWQPFDMPLAGIHMDGIPWSDLKSFKDFVSHCKQIEDADLKFPIIIDDFGYVADGWHRIAKALLNGAKTIKAIRLQSMPPGTQKKE